MIRIFSGNIDQFVELIRLLKQHRHLTIEMARQEVVGRFAGQALGALWAIGHPLFLMLLYIFIFVGVFKQKIGGTLEMPRDFTVYLLAGLIPWMAIQEAMSKSVTIIIAHANLVKQVVFPIEVLPVKSVIASTFTQLMALGLLLCYSIFWGGGWAWTYILLPLVVLLQTMMMVGIAYVLSSVGTYFRDLKDIVQMFSTAGVFIIPAFYLPTQVPDMFRPLLNLNPFSHMVWVYQDVLYFGRIEHPYSWAIFSILSALSFILGYRMFKKFKPLLGNVL